MQGAYEYHDNKLGIKLSYLLSDIDRCSDNSLGVMTYAAYQHKVKANPSLKLRSGRGLGNEVLLEFDRLPSNWQLQCIERFGNPKKAANPLEMFFKMDGDAKRYYDTFQYENGEYLSPKQIKQFTVNASVLEAVAKLKVYRTQSRKSRDGSLRNLNATLAIDVVNFQDFLKTKHNTQHTLPKNATALKRKLDKYLAAKYDSVIDGRNGNSNAQTVTPQMIVIWKLIYAGQPNYKPTYTEVSETYNRFLAGQAKIVNVDSSEIYNPKEEHYKPASERTVYDYQELWENRIATHSVRSGDRQVYKGLYEPYHKLKQPEFASTIISVDDRQPPFEYAPGKRMWFYNAIDLGSEAFTCWVYGESKEGIIGDFYKQLVRNYASWGLPMPYELEGERSLNSSFENTFLAPGAMFNEVRIEANNARGKKIESYYRKLRYGLEKKRRGWLARPFALSESNQAHAGAKILLNKQEIITGCLNDIYDWNNSLHSNQDLHPGMTRWDVFLDKQHPKLTPTNWAGILPHIGEYTPSSMKAGRIRLQGKARVVGFDGKVALGERLINVMKQIEGKQVKIYWLDDNEGEVLKALVYDMEDTLVCELLGDLAYQRGKLEQTEEDELNRTLFSAYTATVQGYIRKNASEIDTIAIEEKRLATSTRFQVPGYQFDTAPVTETDSETDEEQEAETSTKQDYKLSTVSRFFKS